MNKSIPLIQERLDTPELQSDSVAEISMHKAQAAWEKFRRPLLAHDGGLFTNALSGFPGAYIKPVLKMLDIHGLLKLMEEVKDRRCSYKNCLTFVDSQGKISQFEDDYTGIFEYALEPRGQAQSYYNSNISQIMVPVGFGFSKTEAELKDAEVAEYRQAMKNYVRNHVPGWTQAAKLIEADARQEGLAA